MRYAVGGNPFQTLVGAQQIVGAAEIIGQLEASGNHQLANQLKETILARNSYGIQERNFDKARILVVGFTAANIANGAAGQAQTQPQYPFRPCLLSVPSSIAPGWQITDINSGQQPILAAAGAMPAESFSEVAVNSRVVWPTASIGNIVTIAVVNRSGAQATFEATMFGVTGVD